MSLSPRLRHALTTLSGPRWTLRSLRGSLATPHHRHVAAGPLRRQIIRMEATRSSSQISRPPAGSTARQTDALRLTNELHRSRSPYVRSRWTNHSPPRDPSSGRWPMCLRIRPDELTGDGRFTVMPTTRWPGRCGPGTASNWPRSTID